MIGRCNSSEELLARLAAMENSLPPRSQGRTKEITERWMLLRLLATVAGSDLISYPFSASKRERPDFEFELSGNAIGLEISEALQANYAEHQVIQEIEFPDSFMEPGHFRRGPVPKDKQKELLGSGRLSAPPIMGDAMEREWAQGIAEVIRGKLTKLNAAGFQLYSANWLGIKDSLPIQSDLLPKGLTFLQPSIQDIWSRNPTFSTVFLDRGGANLVILSKRGPQILHVNDLWCEM